MRNKIYVVANEALETLRLVNPKQKFSYEWLIRALDAYCGYTGSTAVLVMPPQPLSSPLPQKEERGQVTLFRPETEPEGLRYVCAWANRDVRDGTRAEVVSEASHVRRALQDSHVRLVPLEKFAERLTSTLKVNKEKITRKEPRQKYEGVSDAEVSYWMQVFSEGKDEQ